MNRGRSVVIPSAAVTPDRSVSTSGNGVGEESPAAFQARLERENARRFQVLVELPLFGSPPEPVSRDDWWCQA